MRHDDDFDVTDGAFLPDGDLLLLERRFDLAHGIGMQIRRIAGSDIKPGAVVDGNVIFQAGPNLQIDNMEGLDVFRAADGTIHLIIVSDDNHSILERNLMLEFRLKDENRCQPEMKEARDMRALMELRRWPFHVSRGPAGIGFSTFISAP